MKQGDVYRHYEGNDYVFICRAKHHENAEALVVYRSKKTGEYWFRGVENFFSLVEYKGQMVPRFKWVGEEVLTFDQYEELALRTANHKENQDRALNYAALGFGGETGETMGALSQLLTTSLDGLKAAQHAGNVADYLKKVLFHGHKLLVEKVEDEMGDWLWYANRIANVLGTSLGRIAMRNITKLRNRYPEGWDRERSKNREVESG